MADAPGPKKRKLRKMVAENSHAAVSAYDKIDPEIDAAERKKQVASIRASRAATRADAAERARQARKAANQATYQNGNGWKTGSVKR